MVEEAVGGPSSANDGGRRDEWLEGPARRGLREEWVAAAALRGVDLGGRADALPGPPDGVARLWLKHSAFNPRPLGLLASDEGLAAAVEWPRDYVDVAASEVSARAGERATSSVRALARAVAEHGLATGRRSTHVSRVFAEGAWSSGFTTWEEYPSPAEALRRLAEREPSPPAAWPSGVLPASAAPLLEANGLSGLTRTARGHRILSAVVSEARAGRLRRPTRYSEYVESAGEPLSEEELGALVRVGVLCDRCPGLTWGDVGWEFSRGIER